MKRGISIGLNAVDPAAYNGWDGELWGCIKDSDNQAVVWAQAGYTMSGLLDAQATVEGFKTAITSLANGLQPGDSAFIAHSGHGARQGTLLGGYVESFVLWDGLLSDVEFVKLLAKFKPGVRVIVELDTCHSGGLSRGGGSFQTQDGEILRSRYMPRSVSLLASSVPKDLSRAVVQADVVVMAACREDETALDGPGGGVFTRARHISRDGFESPPALQDWFTATAAWLRKHYPQQHPTIVLLGPRASESWHLPA